MNIRIYAVVMAATTITLFSCSKQEQLHEGGTAASNERTVSASISPAAACTPTYFNLALDGAGNSYVYKIGGSASLGAPFVSPIIGSLGDNIVRIGGVPVLKMTGLSYDPATGTAWGTTGTGGNFPNRIIRFAIGNPNVAAAIPMASTCGIPLEVSDIERDPTTGAYYAINNSGVNPNNRIVRINVSTGAVSCLPNPLSSTLTLRGLTFNCNGQLYVLYAINNSGRVLEISKVTGLVVNAYAYPGVITPGGVGAPEMGLHFDCTCIGKFITGSFNGGPLFTDGLPSGLGGPVYASLAGVIKPTVDFAKP
jgi:hypothetical protein